MEYFGRFMLTIILMISSAIIGGYTLATMWSWFFVPQFNLDPLSIPVAIGIGITISIVTKEHKKDDDEKSFMSKLVDGFFTQIARCCLALIIGYTLTLL